MGLNLRIVFGPFPPEPLSHVCGVDSSSLWFLPKIAFANFATTIAALVDSAVRSVEFVAPQAMCFLCIEGGWRVTSCVVLFGGYNLQVIGTNAAFIATEMVNLRAHLKGALMD